MRFDLLNVCACVRGHLIENDPKIDADSIDLWVEFEALGTSSIDSEANRSRHSTHTTHTHTIQGNTTTAPHRAALCVRRCVADRSIARFRPPRN